MRGKNLPRLRGVLPKMRNILQQSQNYSSTRVVLHHNIQFMFGEMGSCVSGHLPEV